VVGVRGAVVGVVVGVVVEVEVGGHGVDVEDVELVEPVVELDAGHGSVVEVVLVEEVVDDVVLDGEVVGVSPPPGER
jgi:hypothetical protein